MATNTLKLHIRNPITDALDKKADLGGDHSSHKHPYLVGEKYFIRTVTHHYTGKLEEVYDGELVLTQAAWIPDDGRFADAMKSGEFNEVEPYPDAQRVVINRASVLDAVVVPWSLPRKQK